MLEHVRQMDEKYGDFFKKTVIETDISGFNVLLNACKPTILEARPPMRLNVVKEMEKQNDSKPTKKGILL